MLRAFCLSLLTLCLAIPLRADEQLLFSFVRPIDVVQVSTRDAWFPELTAESTPEGLVLRRLSFNAAPQPRLRLAPQAGHWDWSTMQAVSLRLQNAMDWDLTLHLRIESGDGQALVARVDLPAGPAQTLLIPLRAASPLQQGMRAAPPMPWNHNGRRLLVATTLEGELQAERVSSLTLWLDNPDAPQHLLLGHFGVTEQDELQAAYGAIVDRYGQFSRAGWPEKVASDAQLRAALDRSDDALQPWLEQLPEQDRFGGLRGGVRFPATGFFATAKRDGRWFLLSPEGNPFFSLGVNAVTRQHSQTYVQGREAMFQDLPATDSPLAVFYGQADHRSGNGATRNRQFAHGHWYDFYNANRYRVQAEQACRAWQECAPCVTPDPAARLPAGAVVPAAAAAEQAESCTLLRARAVAEQWAGQAQARLKAWGFNSIGNWSDAELRDPQRMPYTLPLLIGGDYATVSTGHDWWGAMPDPFDPRFAMAAERNIAIAARGRRDDPWLLGYFADNELAWAAPGDQPRERYALAYGTLRATTDLPAKRAFLKQLRDRYRNQQGLAKAWGIELAAWELLEDPGFEAPLPSAEFPAVEEDFQRFLRLFADTYFKTIAEALAWHAPHHLLLGGRFAVSTPEALAACAQYCDVLSFNFYTRAPQQGYDFAALRALDKPVLVSEFSFGSRDRGPFWPGLLEVPSEEARGAAYAHFLERALQEPSLVGVHWFQYLDQPVTGRLLDGENGHLGLVGITDLPYAGFVEAVRRANLRVAQKWLPAAVQTPP